MRTARPEGPLDTPMTTHHQKEASGMRTPHRRDISARQDLLGRELRQLFDDYTQEDMPDDLKKLAEQLQAAFEGRGDDEPEPVENGKDEAEAAAGTPGTDGANDGAER
ncbi:NepR family anti-sigma factor [Xanthobacter versatilis]|uniref:NepR family anti-sigma factor n=2 Tax=Xanthobacter autotrophicus (strain ATCC BAA-1158 / Py2) TaxID=78245 RepID=UPI00372726CD